MRAHLVHARIHEGDPRVSKACHNADKIRRMAKVTENFLDDSDVKPGRPEKVGLKERKRIIFYLSLFMLLPHTL